MAQVLPRFQAVMERIEDARRIGEILRETGDAPPAVGRATAGGDPRRLRGIPAVGRNCGGAIRGSNPLGALIRKEARGELRL